MASYIINHIPNINNKTYLELGVYTKATFNAVQAKQKTSVDIKMPADYMMSTDQFFQTIPADILYDVIFIDADHSIESLIKDYNNCVDHLAPDGYLLIHDLVPPDEEHTAPWYCGDSFKLLNHWILACTPEIYVLNGDYGLTLVRNPQRVQSVDLEASYTDFRKNIKIISLLTIEQMQNQVKRD